MDRREFLYSTAATAFTSLGTLSSETPIAVELRSPNSSFKLVPADFIGLSYESGQLYNADFFSSQNTALIRVFQQLTPKGVLRLGGHLSNITPWEGVGQNDPKQVRGVRHGVEDYWEWPLVDPKVQQNKHGMITRRALQNLRGFLNAVDWQLIYGLNFACGSAARAADEASAVTSIMGPRLIAFVIGNEPDGFGEDPFFRGKDYNVQQYLNEIETWMKTIRARVPNAQFAGPDSEGNVDTWVLEYAKRTKGDAKLLTSHFYGMGPASDPSMTAEKLLRKRHADLDAQIIDVHAAQAAAGGTPYRMAEGNSCFGGGRKDVSDAYASALWAADYMLKIASAGFAGVNLHGGGTGVYTPIESSAQTSAKPRPIYYGMQFAQKFVGFRIAPCTLQTSANVSAYQGRKGNETLLALINKGDRSISVKLPESIISAKNVTLWLLKGPALGAKDGVTFSQIAHSPATQTINIPRYTAKLLHATS